MNKEEWSSWLRGFSSELLEALDLDLHDAFRHEGVTAERVGSEWLGEPGLDEAELQRLETRLDISLPPSYRSFLAASNGFLLPGLIVPRLLSGRELAWYRDVDPETVATWARFAEPGSPESQLGDCLLISERELVGTGVFLLNSAMRHPDGEWEALYLAHWIPGANRYRSFQDLLAQERDGFLKHDEIEQEIPNLRPKRVSVLRELWRILRRPPPD